MWSTILLSFLVPLVACLPPVPRNNLLPFSDPTLKHRTDNDFHDLSQFSFRDFQLSDLCVECTRETPDTAFQCSFKFGWVDANFNTSCSCASEPWNWDGSTTSQGPNNAYPPDFVLCEQNATSMWQFQILAMESMSSLSLQLSHECQDDIHWAPQVEYPNFFSSVNVTLNVMASEETANIYVLSGPVAGKINGLSM